MQRDFTIDLVRSNMWKRLKDYFRSNEINQCFIYVKGHICIKQKFFNFRYNFLSKYLPKWEITLENYMFVSFRVILQPEKNMDSFKIWLGGVKS